MAGLFDDHEIIVLCPQCGQEHSKTVRWLRDQMNLPCDGCGSDIHLDDSKFRRALNNIDKAVEEFGKK